MKLWRILHYWCISFAEFVSFSSSNGELFIIQYENKNGLIEYFLILFYLSLGKTAFSKLFLPCYISKKVIKLGHRVGHFQMVSWMEHHNLLSTYYNLLWPNMINTMEQYGNIPRRGKFLCLPSLRNSKLESCHILFFICFWVFLV